jgi:hypothetical protein
MMRTVIPGNYYSKNEWEWRLSNTMPCQSISHAQGCPNLGNEGGKGSTAREGRKLKRGGGGGGSKPEPDCATEELDGRVVGDVLHG